MRTRQGVDNSKGKNGGELEEETRKIIRNDDPIRIKEKVELMRCY